MKRMQLFEFEDFPWFPRWIRESLTTYLVTMHRLLGTEKMLAPLLARALPLAKQPRIVDLCSGGGGPMLEVARELREHHGFPELQLTLTDLFPNRSAAAAINEGKNGARYELRSVDAGNVGQEFVGVRTMVCSMHHMRPAVARRILTDAFQKRQPLCIFEISDNSAPLWLWWLAIPTTFLTTLICTPFVRPFSLQRLFFTYVIPILPLFIAWDGAASNARTYTQSDLKDLLQGLEAQDYSWEIGLLKKPRYPGGMLYLLGLPKV